MVCDHGKRSYVKDLDACETLFFLENPTSSIKTEPILNGGGVELRVFPVSQRGGSVTTPGYELSPPLIRIPSPSPFDQAVTKVKALPAPGHSTPRRSCSIKCKNEDLATKRFVVQDGVS